MRFLLGFPFSALFMHRACLEIFLSLDPLVFCLELLFGIFCAISGVWFLCPSRNSSRRVSYVLFGGFFWSRRCVVASAFSLHPLHSIASPSPLLAGRPGSRGWGSFFPYPLSLGKLAMTQARPHHLHAFFFFFLVGPPSLLSLFFGGVSLSLYLSLFLSLFYLSLSLSFSHFFSLLSFSLFLSHFFLPSLFWGGLAARGA